ncbi:hypothetical protein [Inediibacterium massiliense]|uniref:hypothetical protein n=1 Tax=Inediibacterium massiliense TaxID=1658111 RepID=UPI0006B4932D|nr:hypothetical protein [Inediibacterium massiliense]
MFKELLSFKKDSAFNLLQRLFHIGILPLFLPAFWLGKYFAILFPVDCKVPSENPAFYTFETMPNVLLGIFVSICLLIVSIFIWKIICQILLIIFEALESYINRH